MVTAQDLCRLLVVSDTHYTCNDTSIDTYVTNDTGYMFSNLALTLTISPLASSKILILMVVSLCWDTEMGWRSCRREDVRRGCQQMAVVCLGKKRGRSAEGAKT